MSFLSVSNFSVDQLENLFRTAIFFKTKDVKPKLENKIISLIFFEPSTRTRMSFEMAALRLGAKVNLLNGKAGTSLEKDETQEDTVRNIAAMKPDLLVIRCNDDLDLKQMATEVKPAILNAGWGTQGHPTQALLDILTIKEQDRNIHNEKILFVGDVKHSRVVSSHIELAKLLGYEIAFCGSAEMMPANSTAKYFDKLSDGLEWATTLYSLRVQLERHTEKLSLESFISQYQVNSSSLAKWKKNGLILHPGPVNYGIELSQEIFKDPRNVILNQVEHGVLIRMALIYHFLKEAL
jgi:aspartate carbamoyltransferase catalytic subunit